MRAGTRGPYKPRKLVILGASIRLQALRDMADDAKQVVLDCKHPDLTTNAKMNLCQQIERKAREAGAEPKDPGIGTKEH